MTLEADRRTKYTVKMDLNKMMRATRLSIYWII
jgi:hypothetical protein